VAIPPQKAVKGPSWHKNTNVKKSEDRTVALVPGPGHYQSDKTEIFPIYKYKPSSVFASKVERVRDQKGVSSLKAKQLAGRPPRSHQGSRPTAATEYEDGNDQDIYEDDEDEGVSPGPGYYFNPE
jgi:hypothetical protein